MGRSKKVSTEMDDLVEAIGEYRLAESTIKAKYLALAEKEIADRRERVMDMMFIKHRDAGPSEIANTTGLSRSTVIRWRKIWEESQVSEGEKLYEAEDTAVLDGLIASGDYTEEEVYGVGGKANQVGFDFHPARDTEADTDVHHVINVATGESVFIVWADVYGVGETPADAKMVPRPDWLTDEVIAQAEEAVGFPVPGKKSA